MFYFLHISKCAGSSFIQLARKNVPLYFPNANGNPLNPLTGEFLKFWCWPPTEQCYFLTTPLWQLVANEREMGRDVPFIAGVVYVTILRDPLDRIFSAYQFSVERPYKERPLEERGHRFASFLKYHGTTWRRNSLLRTLTYRARDNGWERLELAKQRLEQFDHVFLRDNLGSDIDVFARHGWTHLEFPWKNARAPGELKWSAAREALREYPELLEQLTDRNAADLELYAHASQISASRKSASPNLKRVPPPVERLMPDSGNFDFLVTCAFEAFLRRDTPAAKQILGCAEKLPGADQVECQQSTFIDFALQQFAKRRQDKERRMKFLERVRAAVL